MAQHADADAQSLSRDPLTQPIADLRRTQADELFAEITRVCGVDETGTPPTSCQVDRTAPDSEPVAGATTIDEAAQSLVLTLVTRASSLPDDSLDLVTAHAIDLLAAVDKDMANTNPDFDEKLCEAEESSAADDKAKPIDEVDVEAARKLLDDEYAALYGLDLASAYADDPLQYRIDTLRDGHEDRISCLTTTLNNAGSPTPAQAPGYEFDSGEEPTSTPTASAFVSAMESSLIASWRSAAADATSSRWRHNAIELAANAQRLASLN
ncbi:hypothetical protein GCM10027157_18570 [Corynebacterium aquatimens]